MIAEEATLDEARAFLGRVRDEVRARDEAEQQRLQETAERRIRAAKQMARHVAMQVHDKDTGERTLVRFGEEFRAEPGRAKNSAHASKLWSHAHWLCDIRAYAVNWLSIGHRDEFLDALGRAYLHLLPEA